MKKITKTVLIAMVIFVGLAGVSSAAGSGRVLHFPKDRSLGRIKFMDANTDEYLQIWSWYWKVEYAGDAQGDVIIPAGKKAALFLYKSAFEDLSPLLKLKPDDIFMLSSIGAHDDQPLLSEKCVSYITHLAGLKYLWLDGTRARTKIIEQIATLQSLELLAPPKGLTNRGLSYISQLKSLKVLSLPDWESRITNAGLTRFIPKLTKLEKLTLYSKDINDDGLVCLAELPMLRFLSIRYGNFTDAGMAHVKKCTRLRNLDLNSVPITDTGLYHLSSLDKLEDLNLFNTEVTDRGLAYLKSLSYLKKLNVRKREQKDQITDAGMVHLAQINSLEYLDLPNYGITDNGLAPISKLKNLKHLWVGCSTNSPLTDTAMQYISNLQSLEYLHIGGKGITDIGAAHLSKLKELKKLHFSFAPELTDNGLAELKSLKNLKKLTLPLRSEKITISGLFHLNTLKNLSRLDVEDCTIQDQASLDISGLTELEELLFKGKDSIRDEDMACLTKL